MSSKSPKELLLLITVALTGCAVPRLDPERNIGGSSEPPFLIARAFYATDRKPIESVVPEPRGFSSERGRLSYGVAYVSIPRVHKLGELERPNMWRLEFRESDQKHIVLKRVEPLAENAFFAEIGARVKADEGKNAFVFVHGYRVSFEEAALRTAQMAYDLGFAGAPVFYSWPSQGSLAPYTVDEAMADWSETNLMTFLEEFAAKSDARSVFLIGHSMGARVLSRAYVRLLQKQPTLANRFKEIVLAAPDIDADVFVRDIAPTLAAAGVPVTLYASSRDQALVASKIVHKARRAGDANDGILLTRGVESIDASRIDTSLIGHSYYGDNRSVISDLFYLIRHRIRARDRTALDEVSGPYGRYWVFKK